MILFLDELKVETSKLSEVAKTAPVPIESVPKAVE